MKPIKFKEQTKILNKPGKMLDKECGPLPVWSDGSQCVSCWKPSLREILSFLFYRKVWLIVNYGSTQPPVALKCINKAFLKETKEIGK